MGSSSYLMSGVHGFYYLSLAGYWLLVNNWLGLVNIGGNWSGELSVHISSRLGLYYIFSMGNYNWRLLVNNYFSRLVNHLTLNSGGGGLWLVIIHNFVFSQISSGSILIEDISTNSGWIRISQSSSGGWVTLYVTSGRLYVTIRSSVHISGGWLTVTNLSGLSLGWKRYWSVALYYWGGVLLHPRVFFSGVNHSSFLNLNWLGLNRNGLNYMLYWSRSERLYLNWRCNLMSNKTGSQVLVSVKKTSNGLAEMRVMSVSTIEISEMLVESIPVELSVLLVTVLNGILSSQL